ncbi:MAG: C_GCAxxG_C_C family protein [Clostridia bacterium]|nr:C_GCAxxG_C_C family protein [Clostridia bacterium]
MNHEEKARQFFLEGYNCAQAVFCAFCEETGIQIDQAAYLASSFGGGMGRLREVCGAVSGALLAMGALTGYADPKDSQAKAAHYRLVQEFAARFREMNGSIICRELLRDVPAAPGGTPEKRTPEFYAIRPCPRLVGQAAALLEQMLAEQKEHKEEGEKNT